MSLFTPDGSAIRALYTRLLNSWNLHSAAKSAALVAENGSVVGFDSSQTNHQGGNVPRIIRRVSLRVSKTLKASINEG
jgi:hypothetical protein